MKSMLICTKSRRKILNSNDDKLNLLIHDRELESVDVLKYLGVHAAYSLSWEDHLKSVTSKVSRGMGMLKQAKCYLPEACLKPSIRVLWSPTSGTAALFGERVGLPKKNGLQKFQKRAARIVNNSKIDASSRPLIERLGWKTIDELIAEESKTFVYKSLHGLAP